MSSDRAFEIRGRYKESVAAEVLRDAVKPVETPLYLGLRAAVIGYSTVQDWGRTISSDLGHNEASVEVTSR